MKSKLFIVSFTFFFFNSANAICVPHNRSATNPYTHPSPNLKPVSSSPSSRPKAPTPSPKAPAPTPKLPSFLPKVLTPSSPAPKAPSPTGDPSFIKNPLNSIRSALPQPGGGGASPSLKKLCDSTDYPDVCLSTLGPLAGPAADASSVLGIAIKAGSDFAKTAIDTAQTLATKPGTPPDAASSLNDCKDSYDDAAYNFQNAADALPKKDTGTMNTMLSAALTNVEDCKDSLEGQDSPLNTISETLRKMASNCLAIIDTMNKPPV